MYYIYKPGLKKAKESLLGLHSLGLHPPYIASPGVLGALEANLLANQQTPSFASNAGAAEERG